jgi:uncharacterized protein (DUF1778 family)
MAKLFEKKPDSERKKKAILLRFTDDDAAAIVKAAEIRNLSVNEYVRRAALGRKADVDYQTEIVLALRGVIDQLKNIYAEFVNNKIQPPLDVMKPVLIMAIEAITRITK